MIFRTFNVEASTGSPVVSEPIDLATEDAKTVSRITLQVGNGATSGYGGFQVSLNGTDWVTLGGWQAGQTMSVNLDDINNQFSVVRFIRITSTLNVASTVSIGIK